MFLRHLAWIEGMRKRVEEATNGEVGYIFVPSTGVDGQTELMRQLNAQVDKKALIVDERFNGYRLELIDLRKWMKNSNGLKEKFKTKDIICLGGGHTYYLRWILKETGTDMLIKAFVNEGKVYAGWSAGAIMAGPTTLYFDLMGDNPEDAPEFITDGLGLTDTVIVPHLDNPDFNLSAIKADQQLRQAGFSTMALKDNEVFIVNGEKEWVI